MNRIIWTAPALDVLHDLRPHSAMIVDRAVIRLAHTGEGPLQWVAPYHRLRAGVHEAALRIDLERETVTVMYVYRARR